MNSMGKDIVIEYRSDGWLVKSEGRGVYVSKEMMEDNLEAIRAVLVGYGIGEEIVEGVIEMMNNRNRGQDLETRSEL